VRCLAIVKPEWVDIEDEHGNVRKEKWPKRPLIVTGSRDHSLRVWDLPRPGEPEYRFDGADEADIDPADVSHSGWGAIDARDLTAFVPFSGRRR